MRSAGYEPGFSAGVDRRRRHAGHHDPAVGDLRALRHHDRDRHQQAVRRRRRARPAGGAVLRRRRADHRLAPSRAACRSASRTAGAERLAQPARPVGRAAAVRVRARRHLRRLVHRAARRRASARSGTLVIGMLRGRLRWPQITRRADRRAARLVGDHDDRGRRLPVRLLPDHHPVHAEGGRLAGRTCRSAPTACWRSSWSAT